MKKAIHVESKTQNITRVLSIAEPEMIESNPTGLEYFLVEDYTEPPAVNNPALDMCYPMYDNINKQFKWVVINYQYTATETLMGIENLQSSVSTLQAENKKLQEVIDTLLAKDLGEV